MAEHDLTPAPGALPPEEPREHAAAGLELLHAITPRAWVTPSITVILVLCFTGSVLAGVDLVSPTAQQLLEVGGDFGPMILQGQWWRLFTSALLHAGAAHLAFNLWALWNVGRMVERIFGNVAFLGLYLLSTIGASLLSIAVHPLIVGVGASGAIFGVYGALLTFTLTHRGAISKETLRRQRNSFVGFFAYNLAFALSLDHIDLAGHAGGLLTGMAAGWLLRRDLLAPSNHVRRRVSGALAFAVLLVAGAWGVRERVARVPEVRVRRVASEAIAAHEAGQYERAVGLYTQCLDMKGDDVCLFNRGLVYMALGRGDAALADLRAAVESGGSATRLAAVCEAAARFSSGDEGPTEAALKDCTRALEMDPNSVRALHARALLHARQQRFDAALADVTREVELAPADWDALLIRGSLLAWVKRFDEAEKDCAALWNLPDAGRAFPGYCADLAYGRGDSRLALERVTRSLVGKPDDIGLLGRRSSLLHDAGDLDRAVVDLDHLLRLQPGNAAALNIRGWYRVLRRDFAGGLEDAERSLVLLPDDANTLGTRCFALVGLGRREEARKDCARAAKLDPKDLTDRGMLAFLDGRPREAVRHWEEAARKQPSTGRDLAPWIAEARNR